MNDKQYEHLEYLKTLTYVDVSVLERMAASYGCSWKKRGGLSAFLNLERKWDRLVVQTEKHGCDLFLAVEKDQRPEGIIDDIRDLRRYLLLVEAELVALGICPNPLPKDHIKVVTNEQDSESDSQVGRKSPR